MKRLWLVITVLLLATGAIAAPPGAPPYSPSDEAYNATTWDGNLDAPTKNAVRDKIETLAGGHDPFSLSGSPETNVFSLVGQALSLDTQTANYIFAGPTTGAAAAPTFRAMVSADLPVAPSLLALTLYGQSAGGGAQLALGSSSTSSDPNTGKIAFRNLTNANIFTFQTGVVTSSWTMTGPTAPPEGPVFLFHVNQDGTTGYTDPASLEGNSTISGSGLTPSRAYYMGASELTLAKADSSTTMPAICVSDSTTSCRYSGRVTLGATVAGCTRGKLVYVSAATQGLMTCTIPTTSGNQVQRVGVVVADDNASILVMPSLDVFTAP